MCFQEFANDARKIMLLGTLEAVRLNHEYIGTEHILLGLLKAGSCITPSMLNKLDFFSKVRADLEACVKSGPSIVRVGKLRRTSEAKKVIELAVEEARDSGHPCVEPEHILLGILREPDGIAGRFLKTFGLNVDELRVEIEVILRQPDRIAEAKLVKPHFAAQPDNQ